MRKITRWCILPICILMITGCNTNNDQKETEYAIMETSIYRQITIIEAKEIMATENNYVVLDVRTQEEYREGHILGAICIPNETIGAEAIPELPDKDQLILVYCRSGNRSKQASQKLVQLGYTNVVEFGGIKDWKEDLVRE